MKKFLAYTLSWLFFWIGDLISYPMNYFDWGWLYPTYNRSMIWSVDLQDWGKIKGPWRYNG